MDAALLGPTLIPLLALVVIFGLVVSRIDGLALFAPRRTKGIAGSATAFCSGRCRTADGRCPLTGSTGTRGELPAVEVRRRRRADLHVREPLRAIVALAGPGAETAGPAVTGARSLPFDLCEGAISVAREVEYGRGSSRRGHCDRRRRGSGVSRGLGGVADAGDSPVRSGRLRVSRNSIWAAGDAAHRAQPSAAELGQSATRGATCRPTTCPYASGPSLDPIAARRAAASQKGRYGRCISARLGDHCRHGSPRGKRGADPRATSPRAVRSIPA